MISTALPDIKTYNSEQPKLDDNAIIFSSTNEKYFYPEHRTPYLFLTNLVNKGHYTLNDNKIEVSQKKFYFLNANDCLEINFNNSQPLQTLFILFSEKFITECFCFSLSSDETFLNSPGRTSAAEIFFPNVPFELTMTIKAKLATLIHGAYSKEELDVVLFELLRDFFIINFNTQKKIKNINAIKKSTREELYRRLFLAEEMMNDMVFEKLTVEKISKAVCLNKFHFLSRFKELYSVPPHRYYKEIKLKKAYDLLVQHHHTVTEVCYLVGFESVGSFSNSFKKRFNISPSLLLGKEEKPNFE